MEMYIEQPQNTIMIGTNMADKEHLEMKIHDLNDGLESIEMKLTDICNKVDALIALMNENEDLFNPDDAK